MSAVVEKVSELLRLHPPANGGIDPKKLQSGVSPSSSPALNRHSIVDPLGAELTSNKTSNNSATPPISRCVHVCTCVAYITHMSAYACVCGHELLITTVYVCVCVALPQEEASASSSNSQTRTVSVQG